MPAGKTEELGEVLEVGWAHVLRGSEVGIAVAIKAGNGALRRITRWRRRAVGRALGFLLGLSALLCWGTHFDFCIVLALIGSM
jgi:hypothetical protein